jgi:3'(2'), 5'-bisphosphate nucleotidase
MTSSTETERLLETAIDLAVDAGRVVLRHYWDTVNRALVEVERKADGSPLTLADRDAHRTIAEGLARRAPGIPLLSEESAPDEVAGRRGWARFWLVDPLDGTKEFLKKSGEFTVNVALITDGAPALGVVHWPVGDTTYFASREGAFVRRGGSTRPIHARPLPAGEVVVVASRDHGGPELEALLARIPGARRTSAGSALKLALVAEGRADLYPRTQPTMEWDTAAGQCVLEAAGGRLTDFAGRKLSYNRENLVNPSFLAWGDDAVDWPRRLGLQPM